MTSRNTVSRWVFTAVLVLFVGAVAPIIAAEQLNDAKISSAIEDELLFDRAVSLNNIDLEVDDGIVTLEGTVTNLLAKRHASRIAETVKGVRVVINNIDVEPVKSRTDDSIRRDVETALLMDPATESFEIGVSVDAGEVTLTGTVDSFQEKELAEVVAAGVKGVIDVNNAIDIFYKTKRTDGEIEPEIEKALRWDTLVDHALIDVKVDDGNVRLSGTVGSAAEKSQAIWDCWVAGVKSVDASDLEVARWARDEDLRQGKYVIKTDEEIRQAIEDAFVYNPRVASFKINTEVDNGVVTLRGTVDNVEAKSTAARIARTTVGVTWVKNRIKVRTPLTLTSDEIADNVRSALLRDPYVERYEIGVSVYDGTVYLSGTVDNYYEKSRAHTVAARVDGVTRVRNNLVVAMTGYPLVYEPYAYDFYPYDFDWYEYDPGYSYRTDVEIKSEIEDELWWSPFVDEEEVTVMVDDGIATLTGTVDTWSERRAATENAYEGGAIWVDNDLVVD